MFAPAVNVHVNEFTVTAAEAALEHLPAAAAVAVTWSPATTGDIPVNVQVLVPFTLVVPTWLPLTKTLIVVPLPSVLVPLTLVAPGHTGGVTVGAEEIVCTVTAAEAELTHSPGPVAVAVTTAPAVRALMPLTVQCPRLTKAVCVS